MGYHFISSDSGQAFLLPQDVREWLPAEHLCWKTLDAVAQMDLSEFMAGYRSDGQGRAAYHPAVMAALVLYCYSKGIRSSRDIEAACWDDVGCRIITANHRLDHATIARFTGRHRAALDGLFGQVLAVCTREGLVDPAAVAIDGSVMNANASLDSNQTLERLEAVIARSEAAIADLMEETAVCAERCESEDCYEPPTDRAGHSPPARLSRLASRLLRASTARSRLFERALPTPADRAAKVAAAERILERAEQTLTDTVAHAQGIVDRYACRVARNQAAGRGTMGRPPKPVECKADVRRQRARLAKAHTRLDRARDPRPIPSHTARASLTDPDSRRLPGKHGGYLQGYNLQLSCVRNQILIAVGLHDSSTDTAALVRMVTRSRDSCDTARIPQIQAWLADNGYASTANFQALADLPLLVATTGGAPADPAETGAAKPVPPGWTDMAKCLSTPAGQSLYKQRAALVEPGFAQLFQQFGRRLHHRGTPAVNTEVKLLGTAHNLGKLFTHRAGTAALSGA